jgi:hypothetical protein
VREFVNSLGSRKGIEEGKSYTISISPTILPEDPNLILPSEKLLLQHPQYLCTPVGKPINASKEKTRFICKTSFQESIMNIMA